MSWCPLMTTAENFEPNAHSHPTQHPAGVLPWLALARLAPRDLLCLARFIRLTQTPELRGHWRTLLELNVKGRLTRFSLPDPDRLRLRRLWNKQGTLFFCQLRTSHILTAATALRAAENGRARSFRPRLSAHASTSIRNAAQGTAQSIPSPRAEILSTPRPTRPCQPATEPRLERPLHASP
jgi:hypothetical protein